MIRLAQFLFANKSSPGKANQRRSGGSDKKETESPGEELRHEISNASTREALGDE